MEYKQNPSASWTLWIPTVWMMKIASSDLAYWFGRADAEPGAGSPYERYLLIFLLCLGLIVLYRRRFDWYRAIKDNAWITLLIVYMFLSMFWSDEPLTSSFKRWVRELIAFIMVLAVLSETNPRNAVKSVLRRSVFVLIPLSLLLVIFFPEYGTETFGSFEAWVGVTTHKNGLGRLCFIAIFFLIWVSVNGRPVNDAQSSSRYQICANILVIIMALYLLKGPGIGKTISITSVITLAVGLVSFFGFLLAWRFKRYLSLNTLRFVTAGIIVIGTASVFIGGLVVGGEIASSFGREETLTGRTQIWADLIPYVMREPIIGYGIDGFFTDTMKKSLGNLPHAHNGFLNIILDYGFVGLFLFSTFLLSLCGKAYKIFYYDYGWGSFLQCFLFMTVIYNVAEISLDSFTSHQMAVLIFLSASSLTNSEYT